MRFCSVALTDDSDTSEVNFRDLRPEVSRLNEFFLAITGILDVYSGIGLVYLSRVLELKRKDSLIQSLKLGLPLSCGIESLSLVCTCELVAVAADDQFVLQQQLTANIRN